MTTTSSPSDPAAELTGAGNGLVDQPNPPERAPIRGRLLRMLVFLLPANLGLFITYGAVAGVLLPVQVTGLDPDSKVANLALVTTIAAAAAMIAQPVAGQISDRTRSRFGRRAPWLILGALVGGLALIGMALANGLVQIIIGWTIAQIAYNFLQGPLSAVVPDRVPAGAFGKFSAFLGMAAMVGAIGGQVIGASFAQAVGGGYVLLAGVVVVFVALFVVFNPDTSSRDVARAPFGFLDFIRTFWVNPVKHPDFFWAFFGRLLLYTGYFSVLGYNLFILSDYVGLGDKAAETVPVLGLLQLAGMIPSILISGFLSDRLGRRKIFVFIAAMIVGLGLVIPIVSPTLTGIFLQAFVCGLGFGAFNAVDQALMNQVLPSAESFGKDLGVVNIAATLPQTLAPAIGGAVVILFGYVGLFPVGIVLSVLGAIAVFFIKSVK